MKAWFTHEGELVCSFDGKLGVSPPPNTIELEVPAGSDANRLVMVDMEVVERLPMGLNPPRTIFFADGQDAATFPGYPVGGHLKINGSIMPAIGMTLTSSTPQSMTVEPALLHFGPMRVIHFQTPEDIAEGIRKERTRRLIASDWTDLPNHPLSEEQHAAWQLYRTALRDMPTQSGVTVETASWPTQP